MCEYPEFEELIVEADIDRLPEVQAFVDGLLEEADCPIKTQFVIDIAVEEMYANIAHYAYQGEKGEARILARICSEPRALEIVLIDKGIPYDPLKKEDPDVTLAAEDRPIGGLGIFMVKKSMDEMSYEYKDGQNITTMKKLF